MKWKTDPASLTLLCHLTFLTKAELLKCEMSETNQKISTSSFLEGFKGIMVIKMSCVYSLEIFISMATKKNSACVGEDKNFFKFILSSSVGAAIFWKIRLKQQKRGPTFYELYDMKNNRN